MMPTSMPGVHLFREYSLRGSTAKDRYDDTTGIMVRAYSWSDAKKYAMIRRILAQQSPHTMATCNLT